MNFKELLSCFDSAKRDKKGSVWVRCPGHNDMTKRKPGRQSLRITPGKKRAFLKCWAGCTEEEILQAKGLTVEDLWYQPRAQSKTSASAKKISQIFDYRDESGKLLFQVVRYEPKGFTQRRPDGKGGWIPDVDGIRRVPYRLPGLMDAGKKGVDLYIFEGENCCEACLKFAGNKAAVTTNSGGAGKWSEAHSQSVKKFRRVFLFPDNDKPGRKHAEQVAESISKQPEDREIRIVSLPGLPEKGDIVEWIAQGHTQEEFFEIIGSTPVWKPDCEHKPSHSNSSEAIYGRTSQDGNARHSGCSSAAESLADKLIATALPNIEDLFHNEFQEPFARIRHNDHLEIHSLRSHDFRLWLQGIGYKGLGKAINGEATKTALETLSAQAVHDGKQYILHNRVAWHEGAIFYDLTNDTWKAVKITAQGWEVVDEPPILFRRYSHQAAQVIPVSGGKLDDLRPFINLKSKEEKERGDEDWLLVKVLLVTDFVPEIAHTIPLFHGPQGSAKTTQLRLFGKFIDPSKTVTLSPPDDKKEAAQLFAHRWFVPLDNMQNTKSWLSDVICRAVTGEGFSKRRLYSDEDDIIFNFRRVVALTGIHPALTLPDALDRAILMELERPKNYRTEEELFATLEPLLPKILGAIFTVLSKALALYPTIKLKRLPRMADFAKWGCAIAEALGFKQEEFMSGYLHNINAQHDAVVHGNPVPSAVISFMEDKENWEGSPTELYGELVKVAEKQRVDLREKGWPKSASAMTLKLKDFQHNLQEFGILLSFGKSGKRTTTLRRVRENVVQGVQSDQEPENIGQSDGRSLDDIQNYSGNAVQEGSQSDSHRPADTNIVHNSDREKRLSLLTMDDLDALDDISRTVARGTPETDSEVLTF